MIETDTDGEAGALLTRRRLVQAGGAAAATLYLGAFTASAGAGILTASPAYLRRSSYIRLRNTSFTASGAAGPKVTLRLAEVADLARARTEKAFAGRDDAFALTLTGPAGAPLPGGVHVLRHATIGTFSVFLAPVGRATRAEQTYEVVVDRSMTLASARAAAPGSPA